MARESEEYTRKPLGKEGGEHREKSGGEGEGCGGAGGGASGDG